MFQRFCSDYGLDPTKAESAQIYEIWEQSLPVYGEREVARIGEPCEIEMEEDDIWGCLMWIAILGGLVYAVCF